jgi:hypothetical protein
MKSFEEYKKNKNLNLFLDSKFGTMYFEPNLPRESDYIIRHLDAELTEELLPEYVDLYNAIKHWIESNAKIDEYICMSNLIEIGKDYIIRQFNVYQIDVRDYFDEDEPIEPPKRYFEMIKVFSEEMLKYYVDYEELYATKETIIKRVLRKSIFGMSGKTVFEYKINKFELVEPKISIEDIEEWQKL